MYVVFAEELEAAADAQGHIVQTLEQAVAQITCRCGYDYQFEPEETGWKLVLTDVERPDCSPEPVRTDYMRPRDAKHDLMAQAVDGRLKGHVAVSYEQFMKSRRRSA
jgi:hypothetical protein